MTGLLIFAGVLVVAVLLSGLAHRSVLSTSVLFLVCGFIFGRGVLGLIDLRPDEPIVSRLVELALFGVLYVEGMRLDFRQLRRGWHLPLRALALGMPLTMGGIAVLAHWLAGLAWLQSFLLGALLSPTDPVFAEAIVGREEVPHRLRHLLNVESGLNDGLALPVVMILLRIFQPQPMHAGTIAVEVVGGTAMGIAVALVVLWLIKTRYFWVARLYEPLVALSIGLLVLGIGMTTGLNEFLAAFAAGVTVATVSPEACQVFQPVGEVLAELFKLAALLAFGALITPHLLAAVGWQGYLFAVLVMVAVRPVALAISFLGGRLAWPEWVAAAWFGPRGFASVLFALLVLRAAPVEAADMFHLAAVMITLSMIAHSSTDILIADWFKRRQETGEAPPDTTPPGSP